MDIIAGKIGELPDNYFAYTPSEIRQAYNVSSLINDGITGKGVTIAIVDAYGDPYIRSELRQFDDKFGLPAPPSLNVACIDGPCNYTLGVVSGWSVEVALDVEWAHAIAPGANINLYVGSNAGNAILDAELAAVEGASGTGPDGSGLGRLGVYTTNVISNSWSLPENDQLTSSSVPILPPNPLSGTNYPWLDQVFQIAAAKGITVFAAAGDYGAFAQGFGLYQTLPSGAVGFPGSDPFVTSVGGTSLYLKTNAGSLSIPPGNAQGTYGTETAWSWENLTQSFIGFTGATAGGFSTLYPQPLYQRGPGVLDNGVRGNPDVAWDADPDTGWIVNVDGVYYAGGGTSGGSPGWAGTMALLDQKAGRSLGFMNPTFYSILNNPTEYSKAFHDITVGNNDGYSATRGWNPLTGIGTPNVGALANIVAAQTQRLSVQVTNNLNDQPVKPLIPTPAYSYHDTITLSAVVNDDVQVFGSVSAHIISQSGATVVQKIPMVWDSATRTYVGSYSIKSTDPPGNWLAEVLVVSGSGRAVGYNGFQVGGSIQIISPVPGTDTGVIGSNFYEVGDTIPLAMVAWNPGNTQSVKGGSGATYEATFHLDSLTGKVVGSVPLTYASSSKTWVGSYAIPSTVTQGAWAVVFSGVDGRGDGAVIAYSWVNVGLFIFPSTGEPTYVLGESMTIFGNTSAATGSFRGTVSFGSTVLGTVRLSLVNATEELWAGRFHIPSTGPLGYYTVTVSGHDGQGNSGSFAEVVRVAPYFMALKLSLSSKVVPLKGGRELISVSITNGNGLPMTIGNVQAYIYIQFRNGTIFDPLAGETTYQDGLPLTYNAASGSFVGVFTTSGLPTTLHGKYTVDIIAFDPIGDYGNVLGSFIVEY